MQNAPAGLRLFRIKGIEVFVHWAWFIVAVYEISARTKNYSSPVWNVLEYLALFAIVTAHEFGHALACRQVGGRADRIVLWPLGGVAYVSPPPRPGALLWSIAAGPLVNAVLIPVAGILVWFSSYSGFAASFPDLHLFLWALLSINIGLFVFNMLPVYPLDGGQILRSLLWYVVGRARSLMITAIIGFAGVGGVILLAFFTGSVWLGLIAVFAGTQCLSGYRMSRALHHLESVPRRPQYQCPSCKAAPPQGAYFRCGSCGRLFDHFAPYQLSSHGSMLGLSLPGPAPESLDQAAPCPGCSARPLETLCIHCGAAYPFDRWRVESTAAETPAPEAGPTTSQLPRIVGAPSVAPVVLGVCAVLLAGVALIAAVFFFVLSSRESGRQPQYQAAIDRLWKSPGMSLPGDQSVFLPTAGLYEAYLDTDDTDAFKDSPLDIEVMEFQANRSLPVRRFKGQGFKDGVRTLMPKASFVVSNVGLYRLSSSTHYPGSANARLKVGPAADLASGNLAWITWGIGILAILFALGFLTAGLVLFWHYSKRRREFNRGLGLTSTGVQDAR